MVNEELAATSTPPSAALGIEEVAVAGGPDPRSRRVPEGLLGGLVAIGRSMLDASPPRSRTAVTEETALQPESTQTALQSTRAARRQAWCRIGLLLAVLLFIIVATKISGITDSFDRAEVPT